VWDADNLLSLLVLRLPIDADVSRRAWSAAVLTWRLGQAA
jgi:hypothetical protein